MKKIILKLFSFYIYPKFLDFEKKVFFDINFIIFLLNLFIIGYDLYFKNTSIYLTCFFQLIYTISIFLLIKIKKSKILILSQLVFYFFMVTFSFFNLNGFHGPFILDIMILFLISLIITRNMFRPRYLMIVLCIYILILSYVNIYFNEFIINTRENTILEILFIIIRLIIVIKIAMTIKAEFEKDHLLLTRSLHELNNKNTVNSFLYEEIRTQKESLEVLNNSLEQMVRERTEEIINKNKKIIDYAFYNSHKLRAPLARIIGLVYLLKINPDENKNEIVDMLSNSSKELDNMVKNISKILDDENNQSS